MKRSYANVLIEEDAEQAVRDSLEDPTPIPLEFTEVRYVGYVRTRDFGSTVELDAWREYMIYDGKRPDGLEDDLGNPLSLRLFALNLKWFKTFGSAKLDPVTGGIWIQSWDLDTILDGTFLTERFREIFGFKYLDHPFDGDEKSAPHLFLELMMPSTSDEAPRWERAEALLGKRHREEPVVGKDIYAETHVSVDTVYINVMRRKSGERVDELMYKLVLDNKAKQALDNVVRRAAHHPESGVTYLLAQQFAKRARTSPSNMDLDRTLTYKQIKEQQGHTDSIPPIELTIDHDAYLGIAEAKNGIRILDFYHFRDNGRATLTGTGEIHITAWKHMGYAHPFLKDVPTLTLQLKLPRPDTRLKVIWDHGKGKLGECGGEQIRAENMFAELRGSNKIVVRSRPRHTSYSWGCPRMTLFVKSRDMAAFNDMIQGAALHPDSPVTRQLARNWEAATRIIVPSSQI
jgi:hypothetical protein